MSPVREPKAAVFDKAGMMARLMDDEDLARRVIEGFLERYPEADRGAEGLS